HLGESIRQIAGLVESVLEGVPDHLIVADIQSGLAGYLPGLKGSPGEWSEHAIVGVDNLLSERCEAEHLPAQLRKGAAPERHLGRIERRPGCLGSEAGHLDLNWLWGEVTGGVAEQNLGSGVLGSERIHAVEDKVGPAIPEVV